MIGDRGTPQAPLSEEVKRIFEQISQDELQNIAKNAFKEALKEWLDSKYRMFGKFTIGFLSAAFLGAVVYFILWANGWKHTP